VPADEALAAAKVWTAAQEEDDDPDAVLTAKDSEDLLEQHLKDHPGHVVLADGRTGAPIDPQSNEYADGRNTVDGRKIELQEHIARNKKRLRGELPSGLPKAYIQGQIDKDSKDLHDINARHVINVTKEQAEEILAGRAGKTHEARAGRVAKAAVDKGELVYEIKVDDSQVREAFRKAKASLPEPSKKECSECFGTGLRSGMFGPCSKGCLQK